MHVHSGATQARAAHEGAGPQDGESDRIEAKERMLACRALSLASNGGSAGVAASPPRRDDGLFARARNISWRQRRRRQRCMRSAERLRGRAQCPDSQGRRGSSGGSDVAGRAGGRVARRSQLESVWRGQRRTRGETTGARRETSARSGSARGGRWQQSGSGRGQRDRSATRPQKGGAPLSRKRSSRAASADSPHARAFFSRKHATSVRSGG